MSPDYLRAIDPVERKELKNVYFCLLPGDLGAIYWIHERPIPYITIDNHKIYGPVNLTLAGSLGYCFFEVPEYQYDHHKIGGSVMWFTLLPEGFF